MKAVAHPHVVARPARPAASATSATTRSTAREETPTFRPNAVTVAAMKESRQRRGLPRFTSMQALFDDLHADD